MKNFKIFVDFFALFNYAVFIIRKDLSNKYVELRL